MAEYIEREAAKRYLALDYAYAAAELLDKVDAADVAPVVHGRWIKTEQENGCAMWTDFECSVCGSVFNGNEWMFDEWKGCPVCLTRMDGE